jgi:Ca2+-binding RTX toxin-like protein
LATGAPDGGTLMPVVVDDYTALLSGDYWNGFEVAGEPIVVTFSFPTTAPDYDSSVQGFTPATVSSFSPFTSAEQAQAISALNEWASASGLVFVQVAPGQGDINFQNVDLGTTSGYGGVGGIGFYPFGDWTYYSYPSFSGDLTASGDVFMNTLYQNADGTVNYGTLLHEIGHAIGLKHPTEVVDDAIGGVNHDQVLSSDDPNRTIMAESGPGADDHLKALDKDAAAYLYGPTGTGGVYTASASGSNSVSNWSWDDATQTLTQTAVAVGETIHGTSVDDIIHGSSGDDSLFGLSGDNQLYGGDGDDKLYDGPGTNLIEGGKGDDSYYITNSATTIVENPGEGGDDTVFARASYTLPDNIETLYLSGPGLTGKGNDQGDSIFGDGAYASTLIGGAGDDYMVGGAGDDTIEGDGGHDLMFGGDGADTFVFKAASDAAPGPSLTTIGDFVSGQDKIDLSAIKTTGANPGQSLTFIGSAPFTGVAGQVNEILIGGTTVLEGDLNGDSSADFQIDFYNMSGNLPVSIQADDLILANPCYREGTRILTDRGEVPVETLLVGDTAVTAGGERRPIIWIGHRRLDISRHPTPEAVWPVRVRAHAFGEGQPRRDLWLSPEHAVCVAGSLIPIGRLLNGGTIAQERVARVAYWHVELESHDVLLAEGLPAESYLDCDNRHGFDNAGDGVASLHPDWRSRASHRHFASPRFVAALREELAASARERGYAATMQVFDAEQRARLSVARANCVRNPRAEGAVAGKIGAGGQAPTYWWLDAPEGIDIEICGMGEERGLPYLELRFAGRARAAGNCCIYPEPGQAISARGGQVWTASCLMRIVGGRCDGVESVNLYIDEIGADGVYLTGAAYRQPAPTEDELALQRASATRRLERPDATAMTAYIQLPVAAGASVDLTLRLAGLQIEEGSYPSELILPPPGEPRTATRHGAESTSAWIANREAA